MYFYIYQEGVSNWEAILWEIGKYQRENMI